MSEEGRQGLAAFLDPAPRAVGPPDLCVPNIHPASSRDKPVLVNDAAEDFRSSSTREVGILYRIHCAARVLRRPLIHTEARLMR